MNGIKTRTLETHTVRRDFDDYKAGDKYEPLPEHRNAAYIIEYYCDTKLSEETQCPKCGKWFARLDLHKKCKGG